MLNSDEQAQFRQLQAVYIASLPEKKQALLNVIEEISDSNPIKEDLENLRGLVHRIAGSGGGYGFTELSTLAKQVEEEIKRQTTQVQPDIEQVRSALAKLTTLMNELHEQSTT